MNLNIRNSIKIILEIKGGIRLSEKPKRKMTKLMEKQLKEHYSGEKEHSLCLTCEVIANKKLIAELKKWYNLTMAEISESMKSGEKYKHIFYDVQDRVVELGKKIKKWEDKK